MHNYSELIQHSTRFSLDALGSAQRNLNEKFQTGASTPMVRTLQVMQLLKTITAIGKFSMFDAILQDELHTTKGFRRAEMLLEYNGETELK